MAAHQIIAALFLVAIWSGVGVLIARHGRIERELVKDEAMPRPAPRATFLVLVGALFTAISGGLIYFVFH
jgi:hypothetical protein